MDGQNDLCKKAAQMKQGLDTEAAVHLTAEEGRLGAGLSYLSDQRGRNQESELVPGIEFRDFRAKGRQQLCLCCCFGVGERGGGQGVLIWARGGRSKEPLALVTVHKEDVMLPNVCSLFFPSKCKTIRCALYVVVYQVIWLDGQQHVGGSWHPRLPPRTLSSEDLLGEI